MKKEDMVKEIAEKAGITQKAADVALKIAFECISSSLEKGEAVTVQNFGTFKITDRAAREGRNPQTGDKLNIPASKAVKFSVGKNLKDRIK